jgi:hypothetical protein
MPIKFISNDRSVKTWFNYFPSDVPENTSYNCRLCNKYIDHYRTPIVDDEGYKVDPQMKTNDNRIRFHYNSAANRAVIKDLIEAGAMKLPENFIEAKEKLDTLQQPYVATSMFLTVFAEVRANIPNYDHHFIVVLLKIHRVRLGDFFGNRWGAQKIFESISYQMNERLKNYLLSNDYPISLLLDTSSAGNHYLSVLFQTLQNEKTTVFLYKLIKLGNDESGQGLFNSLKEQLEEDGLIDYLKTHLVGVATDGARVMTSVDKGVVGYLMKFARNPIRKTHCMAHRLQIALTHATETIEYFEEFESVINKIYKFYMSRSHKRFNHLRKMAEELDERIYSLNYIFKVRWVASELVAVKKIKAMWKTIVKDLNAISTDPSFDR